MHNIDLTVTGGAFAAVREPGWHGLGVVTKEQVDALTLLRMGHGDYPVFHAPVKSTVEVPVMPGSSIMKTVTVEDDRVRNVVRIHPETNMPQIVGQSSPTKQLWNNREIFVDWADQFMDMAKPEVSACGVLDEGRRAFMCWKLPMNILIHGDRDQVELWLMAYTSYDGSAVTSASVSTIRTVCQNTVNAALKGAIQRYAVKRTANAKLNIEQAKDMLGLSYKYAEEYRFVAERMAEHELSVTSFDAIARKLWGPDDDETNKRTLKAWDTKRDTLMHLFTESESNKGIHGTAWGAYNAVAEYVDHLTEVKAFSVTSGKQDEAGFRLWRGLMQEKQVATPKADIFDVLADLVGV